MRTRGRAKIIAPQKVPLFPPCQALYQLVENNLPTGRQMTLDVRAKILQEATRLFAAHGVDGTAIQDIAGAVGVTKQTLLYYYPSKHELQRGVLAHLLSHWSEVLPRLLHAVSREDRFDAILDATIEFFAADADRARLLLREALDRPVEMRELL